MNREEIKKVDLDRSGLLYGLSGINYDTIKSYMQQIDYDRPKYAETIQAIAPAIRRTLCEILDTKDQMIPIINDQKLKIDVMGLFRVNDLIDGLDGLYSVIPSIANHFKATDIEAELVSLFCSDYVRTLIGNSRKINNK